MTKRNYKAININFNLDDAKDKKMYEWLSEKRAKTAFIKDVLEEVMEDNSGQKPDNDLTADEIDIDM